jgi:hypothetical protein
MLNHPYAIAYVGQSKKEFKTAVELHYAEDLQECFEYAAKVVKEIFPKDWKRDFIIRNQDGSETYATHEKAETKTFQIKKD